MQRGNSGGSLSSAPGSANGAQSNGGLPISLPVNAGQQLDLHLVLQRVLELSEILNENRAKTQALVASASEVAARAATATSSSAETSGATGAEATGTSNPASHPMNPATAQQIATLTQQTQALQRTIRVYAREQRENSRLLGDYETAVGHLTALVRDLGAKKDAQRNAAAQSANATLQAERDTHLNTRQERDAWEAKFWRSVGMMRETYKRLCDEESGETGIVQELQSEVRSLRKVIGLPVQKDEEETGWRVLRHVNGSEGQEQSEGREENL